MSALGHDGGKPQDGLKASIDTNVSSAGSMQTPPPTSTSTTRRKAQPEQSTRTVQESPSKTDRRMSTPAFVSQGHLSHMTATEESPVQFPSLEFSPNGFSFPNAGPLTAPVYPQHKLFWDSEQSGNALNVDVSMDDTFSAFGITNSRFPDPFNPDGTTSINPFSASPSTAALQQNHGASNSTHARALNQNNLNSSTAIMTTGSSGLKTKGIAVNPSLLFSSPTRGSSIHDSMPLSQNLDDEYMQPYAQQVRDAKVEREFKARQQKRKRPPELGDSPAVLAATAALRDDTSNSTRSSPVIADSFFGALPEGPPQLPSRKRMTPDNHYKNKSQSRRRSTKSQPAPQPAVTLKIDETGRAVTETSFVKQSSSTTFNDMDIDSDSSSSASSTSIPSHQAHRRRHAHFADLPSHSHHNSTSSFRPPSRPVSRLQGTLATTRDGRASVHFAHSDPASDGNQDSEISTVVDSASENEIEKGDAAAEVRQLVRQRSLSKMRAASGGSKGRGRGRGKKDGASALPYYQTPSRLQQGSGYPDLQGLGVTDSSPTTMTDPDLTPSSALSSSSMGKGTRCVCGDNAEGGPGGMMIQWYVLSACTPHLFLSTISG